MHRNRPVEQMCGVSGNRPSQYDHLLEQVLSRPNMQLAWKRVKANKGAPGVDNMAIDQFPAFARESWPKAPRRSASRQLSTPAGQARLDPQTNGRFAPAGHPHRNRPADPTSLYPGYWCRSLIRTFHSTATGSGLTGRPTMPCIRSATT